VLEQCRKHNTKIVFMSTCMVYDRANDENGITEAHPTKPASPYAGSKIAGENMVLSYWYAYKLPAVVIRPSILTVPCRNPAVRAALWRFS